MYEPELPDFIDANGVRFNAELIYRRVEHREPSDTAIGIFHQPYPDPEDSVGKGLNVRYLGHVNSRVEAAKWDIRKLSAHDCKTYQDALDGCVVVLGAGALSTHHGYDTLFVRRLLTEFRLRWVALPEEWQGVERLVITLRELRQLTFEV